MILTQFLMEIFSEYKVIFIRKKDSYENYYHNSLFSS
jgi:hypothetical protein